MGSTHSPWGSTGQRCRDPPTAQGQIHRDGEIHPAPGDMGMPMPRGCRDPPTAHGGIHGDAEIHPQPVGIHGDGDAEIHPQPLGIHGDAGIHPQPVGIHGDAEIHPQPMGIHGDAGIHPQPMGIHGNAGIHPQPMGIHGDAEIHPQPVGIHGASTHSQWGSMGMGSTHSPWGRCPCWSRWMPGGGCDPVGDPVERGFLLPGWSSLSLGGCTPWNSDPHCSRFGRTAAGESGTTLEKFTENCLLWEGTPRSHRGRTPLPEQRKKNLDNELMNISMP
ncbi:hypothetical protein DUI87_19968 [Hirundo rustica rustica]|uniref:Uncharacterized protein n=1 Tax=Hirundo rustica rustica TaxID=333673 RepID=A0A3M0K6P0_HIRRU|nr:hypothetical protein DUI87_19968 [Hirundo rustica rustica]